MTLPETTRQLSDKMNGIQVQKFDELLASYGYIDLHANEYHDRMHVLGLDVYEVREGFPHIDTRSIPGGIANLKYTIEIGSLESFRINSSDIICK